MDVIGTLRGVGVVSRRVASTVPASGMVGAGAAARLELGLSGGDDDGNRSAGDSLRGRGAGGASGVKLNEGALDLPCCDGPVRA